MDVENLSLDQLDSLLAEFGLNTPNREAVVSASPVEEVEEAYEEEEEEEEEVPYANTRAINDEPEQSSQESPSPRSLIEENPQSALIAEHTSRFSGADWYNLIQQQDITLAGLGGIGSYCAFLLSRLNPRNIIMYDNDIVEAGNMSGQLYGEKSLGMKKTHACFEILKEFSLFSKCITIPELFIPSSRITNVAICGFDNMEARKNFFIAWKKHINTVEDKSKCLFIDGRLSAEEFQVFCITGQDSWLMKEYANKWLFSDREAEETICSYKQTSYCANMIASVMVNLFVNFVANLCDPLIPRALPFMTSYDGSTMMFKLTY